MIREAKIFEPSALPKVQELNPIPEKQLSRSLFKKL